MSRTQFDPVERFVVGTIGEPGSRAFFLQVRSGPALVSLAVEKFQVALLADRLEELLEEAGAPGPEPGAGTSGSGDRMDSAPLETPIEEDFRVTALGLAWLGSRSVVVLDAHDHDPDEVEQTGDGMDQGQSVRIVLTPAQTRAFVHRARAVVAAGRPPCPFCGQALDPTGHICPRANGYKR